MSAVKFQIVSPQRLIAAVKRAGVPRLLMVGGAGSLRVEPGLLLMDTPDFPKAYRGEATTAGADFLAALRAEQELDWVFLSPAAELVPGERTGKFRLGADQLLAGPGGESTISMEGFAVALVDELEKPQHHRQRFTAAY